MSEYLKKASDFLQKTNTELTITFLKHGKHFVDDKDNRDIYEIVIKRGGRKYKFNFGQSINESGEYVLLEHLRNKIICSKDLNDKWSFTKDEYKKIQYPSLTAVIKNKNYKKPCVYSILSCLTKYNPGTFEDFCNEFGYDIDSRKAFVTYEYEAIKDEYSNLAMLFNEIEMEELQEID